jgi:hypothetical protein
MLVVGISIEAEFEPHTHGVTQERTASEGDPYKGKKTQEQSQEWLCHILQERASLNGAANETPQHWQRPDS